MPQALPGSKIAAIHGAYPHYPHLQVPHRRDKNLVQARQHVNDVTFFIMCPPNLFFSSWLAALVP